MFKYFHHIEHTHTIQMNGQDTLHTFHSNFHSWSGEKVVASEGVAFGCAELILLCESLLSHDGIELVGADFAVSIGVCPLNHLQQLRICEKTNEHR